jgi:hypothetical protein
MSDDEELTIYDETTPGLDRKALLLILGGMAIIAVTLAVVQARMKRPVPTTLSGIPDDADWRVSLEHLAAAFDYRLGGIDSRLDELVNDKVAQRAAAYSAPPVNLAGTNGETVERVPPVVEVGPVSDAPQVATTSMPPE